MSCNNIFVKKAKLLEFFYLKYIYFLIEIIENFFGSL